MRVIRKILFWTHLSVGLAAGVMVFVMAVTGVLLTYQKQMTVWADLRGLNGAPPADVQAPLPADTLLARLAVAQRAMPTAVVWREGESTPVEVQFGRENRVFVNAYTAEVLGTGSVAMRGFFRQMTDWHRWLAATGDTRDLGKSVTGAANLAFLLIVLSGMWLWWPRNLTWASIRSVTWFRRGLAGKARDFNWHNGVDEPSGLDQFVQLVAERGARAENGLPSAHAFGFGEVEKVPSIGNAAAGQRRQKCRRWGDEQGPRKIRGAGATPRQRLVEPAGYDVIVEMCIQHEPGPRTIIEIEVVIGDATVPMQSRRTGNAHPLHKQWNRSGSQQCGAQIRWREPAMNGG